MISTAAAATGMPSRIEASSARAKAFGSGSGAGGVPAGGAGAAASEAAVGVVTGASSPESPRRVGSGVAAASTAGGTRTHKPVRAPGLESGAFANFATAAGGASLRGRSGRLRVGPRRPGPVPGLLPDLLLDVPGLAEADRGGDDEQQLHRDDQQRDRAEERLVQRGRGEAGLVAGEPLRAGDAGEDGQDDRQRGGEREDPAVPAQDQEGDDDPRELRRRLGPVGPDDASPLSHAPTTIQSPATARSGRAGVAELADAPGLGPGGPQRPLGVRVSP